MMPAVYLGVAHVAEDVFNTFPTTSRLCSSHDEAISPPTTLNVGGAVLHRCEMLMGPGMRGSPHRTGLTATRGAVHLALVTRRGMRKSLVEGFVLAIFRHDAHRIYKNGWGLKNNRALPKSCSIPEALNFSGKFETVDIKHLLFRGRIHLGEI